MAQEISWDPAANGGSGGWMVSESAPSINFEAHRTEPEPDVESVRDQDSIEVREPTVFRPSGVVPQESEPSSDPASRVTPALVGVVAVVVGALLGVAAENLWHVFASLIS